MLCSSNSVLREVGQAGKLVVIVRLVSASPQTIPSRANRPAISLCGLPVPVPNNLVGVTGWDLYTLSSKVITCIAEGSVVSPAYRRSESSLIIRAPAELFGQNQIFRPIKHYQMYSTSMFSRQQA